MHINVIGAGLAGCEAAWQIAKRGIDVKLYEMKPSQKTPAHHLDDYAELVCSNSMRSDRLENAAGLLKEELRLLDSLIMKCADLTRVPAGGALAVDRLEFSKKVTEYILKNPRINIISTEVSSVQDDAVTVIATGPLTSQKLSTYLMSMLGNEYLYFFDAAAPIVEYQSIDMGVAFRASRYGKGTDDYINCPMNREQYELFYNELVNAKTVQVKDFEEKAVFEGCMPIESMAKRGPDTIRFGPLKPVGLINPVDGKEPYAVVQLRQDNQHGTLLNIVGFQTRLTWPEQKRVFGMIPGLEYAEFARYGVMHKNIFINSPRILNPTYNLREHPDMFFAGQITGVEGYVESTASGLCAGINAARRHNGELPLVFPADTATGALAGYISDSSITKFQPMNISFGLIPSEGIRIRNKRERNLALSKRALASMNEFIQASGI